jgi:hypothetical protein
MQARNRQHMRSSFSALVFLGFALFQTIFVVAQSSDALADWKAIDSMPVGSVESPSGTPINGGPFTWQHGANGELWVVAPGKDGCPSGEHNCLRFSARAADSPQFRTDRDIAGGRSYLGWRAVNPYVVNGSKEDGGVWFRWRQRRSAETVESCRAKGLPRGSPISRLKRRRNIISFRLGAPFAVPVSDKTVLLLVGLPRGERGSDFNGECKVRSKAGLNIKCKQPGRDDVLPEPASGVAVLSSNRGGQTKTMLNRPVKSRIYPWLMNGYGSEFRGSGGNEVFFKDWGQSWWGIVEPDLTSSGGVLFKCQHRRDPDQQRGYVRCSANGKEFLNRSDAQLGSDDPSAEYFFEIGVTYQQNCGPGSTQEIFLQGLELSHRPFFAYP